MSPAQQSSIRVDELFDELFFGMLVLYARQGRGARWPWAPCIAGASLQANVCSPCPAFPLADRIRCCRPVALHGAPRQSSSQTPSMAPWRREERSTRFVVLLRPRRRIPRPRREEYKCWRPYGPREAQSRPRVPTVRPSTRMANHPRSTASVSITGTMASLEEQVPGARWPSRGDAETLAASVPALAGARVCARACHPGSPGTSGKRQASCN